jgi:hypothetical protein
MARDFKTGGGRARAGLVIAAVATMIGVAAQPAAAAPSKACEDSGFALVSSSGARVLSGEKVRTTVPVSVLGEEFVVRGTYVEFKVVASTFGVKDWTFTGAANPLDITGGRRTAVFAEKTPDHRGLSLTSPTVSVRLDREKIEIMRTGDGLSMKIQSKDCAQGGIFQMEPERDDLAPTRITHVLADEQFYFDNPFFRERAGQVLNGVTVNPRVTFTNDTPDFVGRDSPQVADRVDQGCENAFGTHCGKVSQWDVASGGRMGQVIGRFVVLGFPFPVPAESRLTPLFPPGLPASA